MSKIWIKKSKHDAQLKFYIQKRLRQQFGHLLKELHAPKFSSQWEIYAGGRCIQCTSYSVIRPRAYYTQRMSFNSLCGVHLFCFYFLKEQKEGFRGKGNKTTQLTLSSLPSVLLKAHKSIGITYTEPKTIKNSLQLVRIRMMKIEMPF